MLFFYKIKSKSANEKNSEVGEEMKKNNRKRSDQL